MLSKVWMTLDEYIPLTIKGLQQGDFNVVAPHMVPLWEKLEKERVDINFNPMAFTKK